MRDVQLILEVTTDTWDYNKNLLSWQSNAEIGEKRKKNKTKAK